MICLSQSTFVKMEWGEWEGSEHFPLLSALHTLSPPKRSDQIICGKRQASGFSSGKRFHPLGI